MNPEKKALSLNTIINLPNSLKWYILAKLTPFFLIIFFLSPQKSFSSFLSLVIVESLVWLCFLVHYHYISFSVTDNSIIINFGVIIKHSKAISFNKVQNIRVTKGPISVLFNLSRLTIWTSSPSQIIIVKGNSKNKPEAVLWLQAEDADWLKDSIAKKHS